MNRWVALVRHGELPGRAFENSVTCSTGGEGFSCMQDNTLIGIFRRAIQAWLATDLPRKSNFAFLGRTILPWTILRREMSRGPFSSYPQENYEKCHDNKGTNNCIQRLHLHAMLTRSTDRSSTVTNSVHWKLAGWEIFGARGGREDPFQVYMLQRLSKSPHLRIASIAPTHR